MTTRFATSMIRARRLVGAVSLAVILGVFVGGCSKARTGHVYGKVLQANGKPLPAGTVVFYPTEGPTRHASAKINEDGTYDMPDAPAGKVQIAVNNIHLKEGISPPIGMKGSTGMPKPPAGSMAGKMGKGPPKNAGGGPATQTLAEKDKERAPEPKSTPPNLDKYVEINAKYSVPEKSGLTFEVKPGKQEHNITLK